MNAARKESIEGHIVTEHLGAMYRRSCCSCGWVGSVERRSNAWAQTSKLRALMRKHLADAIKPAPPKREFRFMSRRAMG